MYQLYLYILSVLCFYKLNKIRIVFNCFFYSTEGQTRSEPGDTPSDDSQFLHGSHGDLKSLPF